MDSTRQGLDQAEDPIVVQRLEEEEEHEHGATKMFRRVKEKAMKIKNSITKQGQTDEHDNDVDDETDEQESEKHDSPVNESSAVKSGVTTKPEFLDHGPGNDVPAPEKNIPPGTKVFPVVSSDNAKPVEPEPLRDTSYGHESPSRPLKVSDLSDREESRESHHAPMDVPASLLSETEDVTRSEEESRIGLSEDFPKKSHEIDQKSESGMGKDTGVGGKPGTEMRGDFLEKSNEFDQEIESGIGKESPTGFDEESGTVQREDLPAKSHDFDQKMESGIAIEKDTELSEKPGTEMRGDFFRKGNEFDQEIGSGIAKDPPTGFGGESETGLGEEYPARIDNVKAETVLEKESNNQFSPELSHIKESDNSEQIGSATSFITNKATSGEKQESPVGEVAETVVEKLSSVDENGKEKGSTVPTKLSRSGVGSEEEEKGASGAEKLTTREKDKAMSDVISEKLNLGGDKNTTTTTKQGEVAVEKQFGKDWKIKPLQWTIMVSSFAICIISFFIFKKYT